MKAIQDWQSQFFILSEQLSHFRMWIEGNEKEEEKERR